MPNRHAKKKKEVKVEEVGSVAQSEESVEALAAKIEEVQSADGGGDAKKDEIDTVRPKALDFYPFAYALYNEHLRDYCWYCLDEDKEHR